LPIARHPRKSPDAHARLTAFAREQAKQQAALERTQEKLRAQRDKAVRAAYRDGLPMAEIARVLEISHQRVSQIVRS
jgi:DNA-directed RNA polymerase specialized sigma subunit